MIRNQSSRTAVRLVLVLSICEIAWGLTIVDEGESDYSIVLPDDPIPALLLVPDGVTASNPAPGICIWHQHAGQWHLGKSEPAGLAGNEMHHTGAALAREGYVVLCPDALGFEEREKPYRLKGRNLERYLFLK